MSDLSYLYLLWLSYLLTVLLRFHWNQKHILKYNPLNFRHYLYRQYEKHIRVILSFIWSNHLLSKQERYVQLMYLNQSSRGDLQQHYIHSFIIPIISALFKLHPSSGIHWKANHILFTQGILIYILWPKCNPLDSYNMFKAYR